MTSNPAAGTPDVLVLGGGVIGLSCALELLRAGRSVTVLDAGRAGQKTSRGNCGTITPSHLPLHAPGTLGKGLRWMLQADAPLRIAPRLDFELIGWLARFAANCNERDFRHTATLKTRLLLDSRARLAALIERERLDCEFEPSGMLYVWRDARAFERAESQARLLQQLGVPASVLDGEAARQLEPALNESIVGGHHHPGDARLRPDRYVAALTAAVQAAGGVIAEDERFLGLKTGNGRIEAVITERETRPVREVLFALGAWTPWFAELLRLKLPIQPGKGYSITYSRPSAAPRIPLVLRDRAVCVTSWGSGYRIGATMEFAGFNSRLNRVRLAALERAAAEYLVDPVGPAVEEEWFGWRPMTPDDLPLIGRVPAFGNAVLATGHGMLGVSLSAVTAAAVRGLVCGGDAGVDLTGCAPDRFGLAA